MKLLVIISSLDNGGTENHLLGILPGLQRSDMDVSVMTLKPDGYIAGLLRQVGIPVHEPGYTGAGPLRTALLFIHILFYLCRHRPAIVHFFLPRAYLIGGYASLFAPVRYRVMSRRSLNHYQRGKPVLAAMERLLHRYMSMITGNSRAVLADLRLEGVPDARLRLIYNGVSITQRPGTAVRSKKLEQWGIADAGTVMIYVANLIDYKGHADLLYALSLIKQDLPAGWYLLCVGRDAGCRQHLSTLAAEYGLSASVIFTGTRTDVRELLACADIAIMASHQEGFSNSLLEKMAAGLPVIATDVGGNGEAIVDGESGILVPAMDPEAMGNALLALANNPGLQKSVGARARSRVETAFDMDKCIAEYLQLYTGQV